MLEYACFTFFIIAHNVWRRAGQLPWPLGSIVGMLDKSIEATVQPLLQTLESQSLKLLGFVDDQVVTVENILEASAHVALKVFQQVYELSRSPQKAVRAFQSTTLYLQRRGLVGCTADLWIQNEHMLRSKSADVFHFIERLLGGKLIVGVLLTVGGPLAERFSTWLVTNSEAKDKHLVVDNDGSTIPDLDPDTHDKYEAEESNNSDYVSKQLSDDATPDLSLPHHPSHQFPDVPACEVTEYEGTAENLVWVPEKLNSFSSEPTECASNEGPVVATPDNEPDQLIHLFEHSWSLGSTKFKKKVV
ncbi:hypothetical protein O6H91_02G014600 [Diphasiastrum complanatum]|nr:hypothetical protein O6H91_02G014600 [Diphasiastrum complanatum]